MDWTRACNRDRIVYFQGRLDKKLERQKITLNDNLVKLSGTPEDVIIMKEVCDDNGQVLSTVTDAHIVANIVMPVLKDIPIRRVRKDYDGYSIVALVSAYGAGANDPAGKPQEKLTTFEALVPIDSNISVGDRLIKVLVQDSGVSTVMVFDVLEMKGDFSNNTNLNAKMVFAQTTRDIDISKPIYQTISALAKRRVKAGY